MGWMPAGTTFSYGQRSKCADLSGLLRKSVVTEHLPELLPFIKITASYCTLYLGNIDKVFLMFVNILFIATTICYNSSTEREWLFTSK